MTVTNPISEPATLEPTPIPPTPPAPPLPPPKRAWLLQTRHVALVQGAFWVITGLWPILHMPSFLAVSGPKQDLWLVRAMGLLITVVGGVLLLSSIRRRVPMETIVLGIGGALALTIIDLYYSLAHVIWKTYLLDALAELFMIALWIGSLLMPRRDAEP